MAISTPIPRNKVLLRDYYYYYNHPSFPIKALLRPAVYLGFRWYLGGGVHLDVHDSNLGKTNLRETFPLQCWEVTKYDKPWGNFWNDPGVKNSSWKVDNKKGKACFPSSNYHFLGTSRWKKGVSYWKPMPFVRVPSPFSTNSGTVTTWRLTSSLRTRSFVTSPSNGNLHRRGQRYRCSLTSIFSPQKKPNKMPIFFWDFFSWNHPTYEKKYGLMSSGMKQTVHTYLLRISGFSAPYQILCGCFPFGICGPHFCP